MAETSPTCASCGTPLRGDFCHACGERRLRPDEWRLRRIVPETLSDLTSIDNVLWRSLRLLIARPGFLTAEYIAGRRVRYLRPLRLFLILNVVYFLFASYTSLVTFNTPLHVHMGTFSPVNLHAHQARRMVDSVLEPEIAGYEQRLASFEARFNQRSDTLAKSLIVVMIPFFAVLMALFSILRERRLAHHVIFATHFFAYTLFASMVGFLLLIASFWLARVAHLPAFNEEVVLTLLVLLLIVGYLYLALKRLYPAARWILTLKSLGLGVGFFFVLGLYRSFLFFVTFLAT